MLLAMEVCNVGLCGCGFHAVIVVSHPNPKCVGQKIEIKNGLNAWSNIINRETWTNTIKRYLSRPKACLMDNEVYITKNRCKHIVRGSVFVWVVLDTFSYDAHCDAWAKSYVTSRAHYKYFVISITLLEYILFRLNLKCYLWLWIFWQN